MQYIKECFKWDNKNGLNYYHLIDCDIIKSGEESSYWEGDTLVCITKFDSDEVQNTRNRK